ncbi:MAG: hypothetical protein M1828_001648 [Chrysothrix sp. TS-e1954]|nr:MAG: hypothetical protein M1828_001648 [Chrysothrix sp. TS-e1954]
MQPKVLCPEKVSPDGLALLRKSFIVDERKGLSVDELHETIKDYEALIVRSETKVTASLLEAGKKLKVVARAGVGVDNVDVPAASKLGIIVVNSPAGNIGAAAEHTVALLLSVARNVPDGCASLKAGKWERSRLVGVEVKGKTLGIIGLGKVGVSVARMAIGLGMRVNAMDPYASPAIAQAAHVTMVSALPELLEGCDFLTIHTPLIASTKGMIAQAELLSMRKGARVLNVARGGMFDEAALLEALESGHIAGAGIDVFTQEPPAPDSVPAKLIAHPKVVATPHLGASTVEAQENVSIDVCEQVLAILNGELPRTAINAPLILPEEYKTLQPFVRLVEKMGSLYTQHYSSPTGTGTGQDQSQTTFDLIYEGTLATVNNTKPLFAALVKGLIAPISATNVNIVNAEMIAKDRGILINEQHSREAPDHSYSSLVTLRSRKTGASRSASPYGQRPNQVSTTSARDQRQLATGVGAGASSGLPTKTERTIAGYVSGAQIFISKMDRFATSFAPEGDLLICHNYDSPGMIGVVGGILGKEGVNINFMSVAPLSSDGEREGAGGGVSDRQHAAPHVNVTNGTSARSREALMILGVDGEVDKGLMKRMSDEKGILAVSKVTL